MPTRNLINYTVNREEAARQANAERARRWRANRRARGEPLPRDADAAIAEALRFLIARNKRDGVNIESRRVVAVDPADIAIMAKLILEREGHDRDLAGKLVRQRMQPGDEHSWPDHMPTLAPGPVEWMRETRGGAWTTPLDQVYAVMNGRRPSFGK